MLTPPAVTLPERKQATLAPGHEAEGGAAGGELGAARTMAVSAHPRHRPGPVDAGLAWLLWVLTLSGLAAVVWLDHLLRRAGRSELTIRRPRAALHRGGGRHGDGRGGAGQPPAASSRRLADAGPGAVGDRRRTDRQLRPVRAPGQPGGGPGRRPPSRARRHLRPLAGLHRLHPAAHTDRLAAVPALAMVGRGSPPWRRWHGRRRSSSGPRRSDSPPSTRSGTPTSFPPWRLRRWWSRSPRS